MTTAERTMIFDAFPLGIPLASGGLREDILHRAFAGDPEAQRLVRQVFPIKVPADLRRAERDRRIRAVASELWAALPGASTHRVAAILRAAGASLEECGRGLSDREPFNALDREARAALEREIRAALEWAPAHRGNRWPALRQLIAIIANRRTFATSVVETANT
jgi:hypothetical protein